MGLGDAVAGLVDRVEVRTSLTPPVSVRAPLADTPPSLIARILRLQVTAFSAGGQLFDYAPHGEPPQFWPVVVGGIVLGGVGLVALGYALGRRRRR